MFNGRLLFDRQQLNICECTSAGLCAMRNWPYAPPLQSSASIRQFTFFSRIFTISNWICLYSAQYEISWALNWATCVSVFACLHYCADVHQSGHAQLWGAINRTDYYNWNGWSLVMCLHICIFSFHKWHSKLEVHLYFYLWGSKNWDLIHYYTI